ncbi:hypothetical protein ABZP36_009261 [Zizania latifolia]
MKMEAHMNMGTMGMSPISSSWSTTTPRLPFLHHLLLIFAVASDMDDRWPMVERRGPHLWASGRPFIIHGFNTYWLMSFAADEATRPRIAKQFIAYYWLWQSCVVHAMQLMISFLLCMPSKALILLLPKSTFSQLDAYQRLHVPNSLHLFEALNFCLFSLQVTDIWFPFHFAVVTRINTITNEAYSGDPTILAWELINEPRCPSDPSGDTLQAWIEEMASYVKSIDPVHLVEVGLEGFYGPSTPALLLVNPDDYSGHAGIDFIRNHQALGIDLASVHIYSDTWLPHSIKEDHLQFVNTWMQQHIDDAVNLLGMPVLIGEFGVSLKDGKFGKEFREDFIETVYRIFLSSWKGGVVGGGCLLWQLFPEGAEHMDDGYAVIFAKSPSTLSLLSNHSRNLEF